METTSTTSATPADNNFIQYECGENAAAPLWMRILGVMFSVLAIAVGGFANLTAFIAFATNRSLWHFSNINLFLLTVNDLILTVVVNPHYIVKYWLGCWPLSQHYCNVFMFVLGSAYISSLFLVALISYDRYLMVKLGAAYRQQQSVKTVLRRSIPLAICVPCAAAAFLVFTTWYRFMSPNSVEAEYIARTKCLPQMNVNGYNFAAITWTCDLIPLGVMLFCYVSVFRRRNSWAMRRKKNLAVTAATTLTVMTTTTNAAKTNSRRAARLLNALFATMIVTQVPYMVTSFVNSLIMIGATPDLSRFYWASLYELSSIFATLNDAANPILYAYTMPDFEQAARNVWQPLWNGVSRVWKWMFNK